MGTPAADSVRALYEELTSAWNRRDPAGMAALFSPRGVQIGFDGSTAIGPDEIESHLAPIFADHPTAAYLTKVIDVRLLTDDSALLLAIAGMVPPGKADIIPAANTHHTVVATRGSDGWRVELFQSTPAQFHGRPELVEAMSAELRTLLR